MVHQFKVDQVDYNMEKKVSEMAHHCWSWSKECEIGPYALKDESIGLKTK